MWSLWLLEALGVIVITIGWAVVVGGAAVGGDCECRMALEVSKNIGLDCRYKSRIFGPFLGHISLSRCCRSWWIY